MKGGIKDGEATMSPDETKSHLTHCMVVYAPYPYYETRVQREAEALIARGYEVDLICPVYRDDPAVDHHGGVTIYRINLRWHRKKGLMSQFGQYAKFIFLSAVKLTSLHFKRRYSVIQCHNLPDVLVFSALIPRLMGARVILDLHDLMPEFYQGKFKQSSNSFWLRLIYLQERWSCRFASHVITVTKHWRETLIRRGVPPDKCSVVMNLADTRIFKPLTREELASRNDSHFNLFYHGDMPERYGLDLLIRAVARLHEQYPQLHLILVGGGQFLDRLKQIAAELNLDENTVEFMGGIPAEQLRPQFARADLGVVPYRNDIFTDSLLPTKLMEYALLGLPTIAARTTAISGYFDDSMVKFFQPDNLDDLANSIASMIDDPALREEYTRGIGRFNELHNWAQESADYAAIVDRLGAKRK